MDDPRRRDEPALLDLPLDPAPDAATRECIPADKPVALYGF